MDFVIFKAHYMQETLGMVKEKILVNIFHKSYGNDNVLIIPICEIATLKS